MLLNVITNFAGNDPTQVALKTESRSITYSQLSQQVAELSYIIARQNQSSRLAVALNNSAAWVILDIAAMELGMPSIPLPAFFSNDQLHHAVLDSGANLLITDTPQRFETIFSKLITKSARINIGGQFYSLFNLATPSAAIPDETIKITYTSGTTGNPKGVCLSSKAMLSVASSIQKCVGITEADHHLCVLPLSTLLENVAGVYATLLGGGCLHLYPSEKVGLNGSQLDIKQLHHAMMDSQASTAILIPELLKALVLYCGSGAPKLIHLRFLAVGGAHVATQILNRATQIGLPVYQGYGLSESASVVSLNTHDANLTGSVGKPLPHIDVKITDKNEILVKGANFLGYTHEDAAKTSTGYLDTGDIGYVDHDGFLHIQGRKKNIFITSYGRNVSPEWVETELTQSKQILQACLFGEAKPFNTAIIVTAPNYSSSELETEIAEVNKKLPDYARISKWLIADSPFSIHNGQLTANGRLKRDAILQAYQHKINAIY
jgi:long-chain acyl-CoA synthetase